MTARTLLAGLVALAVAGCGGGSDDARRAPVPTPTPASGPAPVVLATKNFTEQYVLGHVYRLALESHGFDIDLKEDVGSSEIVDQALQIGVVDMYIEYIGVIAGELAGTGSENRPRSREETYRRAKAFQERRGFTILQPSPGYDALAAAVLPKTARRHRLRTLGDLRRLGRFRYGGPAENRNRFQGAVGMRRVYDLEFDYVPLPMGERYDALTDGDIDVAAVFTTEGQLAGDRYVTLADPEGIFGFQNLVPVIERAVLRRQGPEFRRVANAVTGTLTNEALRRLNAAVDLDGRQPAEVAREFVEEKGLLG